MNLALSIVRFCATCKRKTSMTYGIPRTMLLDKPAGRVSEAKSRPGPEPVLKAVSKAAKEVLLARYIYLIEEMGYPLLRVKLIRGKTHP